MARPSPKIRTGVPPSPRPPHFFKVYLPQLSSERLKIPPVFWKHIHRYGTPKTASLKGPGGNIWYTNLMKDSDGLFFDQGWKEFIHDHSIQAGDILVFRYEGNFNFDVLVFDATACEKETAFLAWSSRDHDVTILDASSGCIRVTPKRKRGSPRKSHGSDDCVVLEGPLAKKISGCEKDYCNSKNLNPRQAAVMPNQVKGPVTRKHSGCEEDSCKSNLNWEQVTNASAGSRTKTLISSSSEKLSNSIITNASVRPCKGPSTHLALVGLKSQRRPVTQEELDIAVENAKAFKSERPFFTIKMQNSYVYVGFFLNIPSNFSRKHLPKDDGMLILRDLNGERWEVKFKFYKGNRCGLGAGWSQFSRRNNLETGDVCIFEVIKKYQFKVHIFRVVEELTPYL